MSTEAQESADHWSKLADEQERMAAWYEAHGLPMGDVSSYYHRANTYRRTAEALQREADTGRPHCSACGGSHAAHEHPSVAADCGCKCLASGCPWCFTPGARTSTGATTKD